MNGFVSFSAMSRLLLIFACQLLLADASDKRLKEVPNTEQSIDIENENSTEPVVVFAPPVSGYRLPVANDSDESPLHATSYDTTGFCTEDSRCGREGSVADVSARRYNNTGEPVSHSVTTGTSADDTNADISDSVNDLTDDKEQGETLVESIEDRSSQEPDNTAAIKDNNPLEDSGPSVQELLPDMDDTCVIEDIGLSQLDQSVADVPISDLRAGVYQKLGGVLENRNTHDGSDPWWNYLILNDNGLDINRRQQRNIENTPKPGCEFMDILDESGYTLQDLENLFMRHQMHEALNLLRFHQFDVIGQRSNIHTSTEREADENRKPEDDFSNSLSGESETDNEQEDSNQNDEKEPGALNNKKDDTSVDSTDDDTYTSTQGKTQTPKFDHCNPNPCKNEGKCIRDEDGYTCKCSYKWYSGKNCEKDNGPCRNACFKPGTSSCDYSGPDGQNTACNCKIGYDGDQCETEHDHAKHSPFRHVINSCNERGLSKDECIADTLGVDTEVNSLEGLFQEVLKGKANVIDMFLNVVDKLLSQGGKKKLFGDSGVGKVVDKWKKRFVQ
ncbi:uncharacterized protein LOC123552313 isoform X2 [Mercenaria mercenaria]|uniref:uncharacterized protein LOC123552313 isoform X2 n=1 Tax=Mercenaria mercenaria TaxID=6596 RepID=UPI00234F6C36|nr:uncharacterized protein LOC123552313 isoform X2 [Mercenaria mercenaria]